MDTVAFALKKWLNIAINPSPIPSRLRPQNVIRKALAASNARLKSGGIDLWIEIKSNHLVLRGILPPKPDSDRQSPYEQRIYLSYPVMPEGIRQAEKDAISIKASLIEKRFDWHDWSSKLRTKRDNPVDMSCGAISARSEVDYFNRRAKNSKSETTWGTEYMAVYKKSPQSAILTKEVIMAAIATITQETRTRRRYVQALAAIAKFAGLEIDIKEYGKGYTPAKLEIRDLPNDKEIEQFHALIPTKSWQNAYALIATFGIRPHEIVHLDLSYLPLLHILEDTKTGSRIVRALPPKWVDMFGIEKDMELPKISAYKNKEIGSRVGHQFERYGIPFPAYNLRHAYAVRCSIQYQMPVAIAARMMGHSANIHHNTYLKYAKEESVVIYK